jgi:hypothetical protein
MLFFPGAAYCARNAPVATDDRRRRSLGLSPVKRQKGKISHAEWPQIALRHEGGESFASIARSYGCTAPAIRYIVGRRADLAGQAAPRPERRSRRGREPSTAAPLPVMSADGTPSQTPPASDSSRGDRSKQPAIDASLRDRLVNDIAAFIVSLDTAVESDSAETRRALLGATDRLLRACARARLELVRNTREADIASPTERPRR